MLTCAALECRSVTRVTSLPLQLPSQVGTSGPTCSLMKKFTTCHWFNAKWLPPAEEQTLSVFLREANSIDIPYIVFCKVGEGCG